MQKKIAIYTAIFGKKDYIKGPGFPMPECDLICFTDDPHLTSNSFDVKLCPAPYSDPNRNAKIYKVLPHVFLPQYEYSIWIDGSVMMKRPDIQNLIDYVLSTSNWATYKHPERNDVYEEAEICIERGLDDPEVIKAQMAYYKSQNYPRHNGLNTNTIIVRRHMEPDVIELSEAWWNEIQKYSRRDQLSFNYVAWKKNFKDFIIEQSVWDNEYFKVLDPFHTHHNPENENKPKLIPDYSHIELENAKANYYITQQKYSYALSELHNIRSRKIMRFANNLLKLVKHNLW